MNIKKLTQSSILIAIGVAIGNVLFIPVGIAKCYPIQHVINVLTAVLIGPWYAVANAFVISIIRNMLGVGSLLAFPGSMIGAALAGILYYKTKKVWAALLGELVGTGVIGAIVGWPIANLLMGKSVGVFTFVIPFILSSFSGIVIASILLKATSFKKLVTQNEKA